MQCKQAQSKAVQRKAKTALTALRSNTMQRKAIPRKAQHCKYKVMKQSNDKPSTAKQRNGSQSKATRSNTKQSKQSKSMQIKVKQCRAKQPGRGTKCRLEWCQHHACMVGSLSAIRGVWRLPLHTLPVWRQACCCSSHSMRPMLWIMELSFFLVCERFVSIYLSGVLCAL